MNKCTCSDITAFVTTNSGICLSISCVHLQLPQCRKNTHRAFVKATTVKPTSSMCTYDGNATLRLDGNVYIILLPL